MLENVALALKEFLSFIGVSRSFKHCHLCGRRLRKREWIYAVEGDSDEQAIVVCRRCHQSAPRCDDCGAPVGGNHITLPDGRYICPRCHQTAIYDQARGREIFERVASIVTNQLGLGLNVGTDFTLVDHQHLQRLAVKANDVSDTDLARVIGLFSRKGHQRVMYLLLGLPQISFIQATAHEWAHAWEGENCPLMRDLLLREGFAEWVAHKTLRVLGAVKKVALMERREGLYGEGLRKMLALERRVGASGVLDFCRWAE